VKILLLSDTHDFLDSRILHHAQGCNEIWHCGDFGSESIADQLESVASLRGVYGNVDGQQIRQRFPLINQFEIEGLKVLMIHIGGYPGRYAAGVKKKLMEFKPQLFISGHSHFVKIVRDRELNNLLHINPGAAGTEGFHTVRTVVTFEIIKSKIEDLQVIELGLRSSKLKT